MVEGNEQHTAFVCNMQLKVPEFQNNMLLLAAGLAAAWEVAISNKAAGWEAWAATAVDTAIMASMAVEWQVWLSCIVCATKLC